MLVGNLLIQFDVLSVWYEMVCIITWIVIWSNRSHLVLANVCVFIAFIKLDIIISILTLIWLIMMRFQITIDKLIFLASGSNWTFTWKAPLVLYILFSVSMSIRLISIIFFSWLVMFWRIGYIPCFYIALFSSHFNLRINKSI